MAKLNQVIAIEKGVKSRVYGAVTDLNKIVLKPALFNGFTKTYERLDDESETLPGESQKVQFVATDVLRSMSKTTAELFTVIARKDWSNCAAKADVVVDGETLVTQAPVSYLLFLEKQLTDLRTFISNMPILDLAENWTKDANSGLYKTEATRTHRTKKTQKPIVLFPATVEHPAQTQMITEDVIAGHWKTEKQSGALTKPEKTAYLERVEKVLNAVKEAREAANSIDEAPVLDVGAAIFGFVLGA